MFSPIAYQRVRYIINQELGLDPPPGLLEEFTNKILDSEADREALDSPSKTANLFREMYIDCDKCDENTSTEETNSNQIGRKLALSDYHIADHERPSPVGGCEQISALTGHLELQGQVFWTQEIGDGPMDCLVELLHSIGLVIQILEHEMAVMEFDTPIHLKNGDPLSGGKTIAYVKCSDVRSYTA